MPHPQHTVKEVKLCQKTTSDRRELLSVSLPAAIPMTSFQCSECSFQSKAQVLHQSGGEDVLYDAQRVEAWTANSVCTHKTSLGLLDTTGYKRKKETMKPSALIRESKV